MLHTKHVSQVVLAVSLTLAIIFAPQISDAVRSVFAASKVYADGYYDSSPGTYVFGGVRSDMECANPTIRDGGFSIMRAAVAHKAFSDPNPDYAFIELGCAKYPGHYGTQSRYVYASWVNTGGVYGEYTFLRLNDGDYVAHDYRVAIKNDNL